MQNRSRPQQKIPPHEPHQKDGGGMKSITIKDMNGEKMIRVFHNGEGEYFVERLSTLPPFTVVIVLENKERTKQLWGYCVKWDMVTPVFECPVFEE
jgi:hypothetical protein